MLRNHRPVNGWVWFVPIVMLVAGADYPNVFTEGSGAILQILNTAIAGFFFYLVLRVTGRLVAGMALHGLWDAALFTGFITDEVYAGAAVFMAASVIMAVTLLVRRHKIGIEQ